MIPEFPMINSQWTVNETIQRLPESLALLNGFGIDTCCGGVDTLEEAARRSGVELATIVAAVEALATSVGTDLAGGPAAAAPASHGCRCSSHDAAR
jgi:iron-sulfur cluster repair protein YtfE (RIC family)